MKVVILSDDRELVDLIAATVRFRWRDASVVTGHGEAGLSRFREQDPEAVVLDLATEDSDGFALLRAIRRISDAPVLVVGARKSDADQLRALELGADDYVPKPVGHLALVARLNALMRRARPAPGSDPDGLQVGALRMYFASRQAWMGERALSLGEREFALLAVLARSPDHLLSAETLRDRVWGPDWGAGPSDVKALIHRLRAKLQGSDGCGHDPIETARGRGYRFVSGALSDVRPRSGAASG